MKQIYLFATAAFAALLMISSCASSPNTNGVPAASPDSQTYSSTGVVKAVDVDGGKVTVDHEDIPGYMSAMQMTEPVADRAMLNGLKAGDKVEFEILRTGSKVVFTKFKKIGEVAVVNGREVFETNCAKCHGEKGEGSPKGISLVSGHALAHSEAEYVQQVENGKQNKMPAFKDKLTADQIAAVVKYLRTEIQAGVTPEQREHKH